MTHCPDCDTRCETKYPAGTLDGTLGPVTGSVPDKCPDCGRVVGLTSLDDYRCSICGQGYGVLCDGYHRLCPRHDVPYIGGECRMCLEEEVPA